ncbi:hypothetical protein [Engelhardtia mirabilis]|uniref:Uncharacterized protein n=1 Tax=Engelhardtia mirabilis TaxID=2528011 RepID=A0A518BQV0_9BACT|nr:hypothetical protein Pla133_44640 [Planctomycetes bacterium Pla133]QDV03671.1 hypothetical protein Pla86_44620 [Planctomycetes bacterium Pla86]
MINNKKFAGLGLAAFLGAGVVALSGVSTAASPFAQFSSDEAQVAYSTLDHTMGVRFDVLKSDKGSSLLSASGWIPPKISDLVDPFTISGGTATLETDGMTTDYALMQVGGAWVISIPTDVLFSKGSHSLQVNLEGKSPMGDKQWTTWVGLTL